MERRFHHLVRAVIEHGGHFLLARPKGHAHTFLPGGHLEPFEHLTASLTRELGEEAGITAGAFTYLGVMENEYEDRGVLHAERAHLFCVEGHGLLSSQPVSSHEPHLEFLWVRPEQFAAVNLRLLPVRALLPAHRDYRAWHFQARE